MVTVRIVVRELADVGEAVLRLREWVWESSWEERLVDTEGIFVIEGRCVNVVVNTWVLDAVRETVLSPFVFVADEYQVTLVVIGIDPLLVTEFMVVSV